jgi:hypothetical protein
MYPGAIMEKNIGYNDRLARLILGLCAIVAAFFIAVKVNMIAGIIVALLGVFTIYEALVGWCIIYKIMGINTCPIKSR